MRFNLENTSKSGIYFLFGFHILGFGFSGFNQAYFQTAYKSDLIFLYMHGGVAISTYLYHYIRIFGVDEVKWMFINAGLGILGIYSQIDWLLSLWGKKASNYGYDVHVIPFLYYILYTFLLHQALLDLTNARENANRKRLVETGYVAFSIVFYGGGYLYRLVKSKGWL